ncbi:MAG: OmpH family outer membrane protein, partial [Rhodobacteraceae bacterium]|nr:OmpH family outer membrane protein [Paracoccaceae bacterium]
MRGLLPLILAGAVLWAAPSGFPGGPARAADPVLPQSPLLTIDQEKLFRNSAFGQRVVTELEAATARLSDENRKIEERLIAEEKDLTQRRSRMSPEEFRKLADAFDEKVVGIRRAQDGKERSLTRSMDQQRQAFFEGSFGILAQLVRESGAVAILDSRSIVLSSNAIDITDIAIERIDAVLG